MSFLEAYDLEKQLSSKFVVEAITRPKSKPETHGGVETRMTRLKWTLFEPDGHWHHPYSFKSPIFVLGRQLARLVLCRIRRRAPTSSRCLALYVEILQELVAPMKGKVEFTVNKFIEKEATFDEEENTHHAKWGCYDIPQDEFEDLGLDKEINIICTISLSVDEAVDKKPRNHGSQPKPMENFGSLFESGQFSDVTLLVGTETFRVHKNILSTRCPGFEALFLEDTDEAEFIIDDMDASVAKNLLTYIYTGQLNMGRANDSKAMLQAADKYGVDGVKVMFAKKLSQHISQDDVIRKLIWGDKYRSQDLLRAAVSYISRHRPLVVNTAEWTDLKKHHRDLATYVEVITSR